MNICGYYETDANHDQERFSFFCIGQPLQNDWLSYRSAPQLNRVKFGLNYHPIYKSIIYPRYYIKPQSDERLRLPTTCDYLRPAVIVGSRSDFCSHTLRSLYDRSSMIVAFWSLSRMQVADCCTTIVRPSYDSLRLSAICHD